MTRNAVDIASGVTLNIRSGNRSVVQDCLINDGTIDCTAGSGTFEMCRYDGDATRPESWRVAEGPDNKASGSSPRRSIAIEGLGQGSLRYPGTDPATHVLN